MTTDTTMPSAQEVRAARATMLVELKDIASIIDGRLVAIAEDSRLSDLSRRSLIVARVGVLELVAMIAKEFGLADARSQEGSAHCG